MFVKICEKRDRLLLLASLCLFAFEFSSVISAEEQPRVETPHGSYLGSIYKSGRSGHTYYGFTGIPYAKPPVGNLRFKAPEPFDNHPAVFNATSTPPECLQWDTLLGRGMVGSENCLYLNVYTNRIPEPPEYKNTEPILVFLHGGTWLSGSGASDIFTPDYLIEAHIMVITLNHRLGPFGFLTTGNQEAPGNYGLLDQILALEWIRNYARYFGGMNDTVTVMGSGAGGISSHFLTLTPKSRGAEESVSANVLLQRAISQSGTAYSPHAIVRNPVHFAVTLALRVGCDTNSSKSLVDCLRGTSADLIVNSIPSLFEWDEEPVPFGPVIDKEWMGEDAFFPDEPHHIISHGKMLKIPWIVGTNKNDGAFRVQDILKDTTLVSQLNQKWEKYGPILLHLTKDSCKDPVDMANKIRDFYFGKDKFGTNSEQKFIEMMTDRFFLYPTEKAAKDHCYYLWGHRLYCYRYEHHYCGQRTFFDILHKVNPHEAAMSAFGSALSNPRFQNIRDKHGYGMSFLDELIYLFPSNKLDFKYEWDHTNDDAAKVSAMMLVSWTNFVKGGDPTPLIPGYPEDVSPWNMWWEPYVKGTYFHLQIDPDMMTQEVPLKERQMSFWADLPLYENRDRNVIRDEL